MIARGAVRQRLPTSRQLLPRLLLLLALLLPAWPGAARAAGPDLDAYVGAYVGRAVDELVESGSPETRDIDIVILRDRKGGLRIQWTNVTLVDGRRDVPGVQRRVSQLLLVPAEKGSFLVEATDGTPFRLRDEVEPLHGDAMRWAMLDEQGLHVYVLVLLEDGRYEMQTTTRRLTPDGLDLLFERNLDGKVVRRIKGHAVRAG